ncbi:MAG: hypothetical protein IJD63_03200 [Oscillospiraceae bacterium]|nr:hypothetical protein [Oscillospiraceae bacterium]
MKKLFALLLILCVLFVACTPATNTPDTTEDPTQATDDPNTPDPTENPTQAAEDPRLAEFDALFGPMNSRYNWALTSQYADPTYVNLKELFYNGFSDESAKPTDAEWEELKDLPGFDSNYDLVRLPVDKMNQVLTQYFGITLEDVNAAGFAGLAYLESTDCYYRMCTDASTVENFKATAVEELEDGTVRLYYTGSSYALGRNGAGVAVLRPVGDGYQIISNQKAE